MYVTSRPALSEPQGCILCHTSAYALRIYEIGSNFNGMSTDCFALIVVHRRARLNLLQCLNVNVYGLLDSRP